MFSCDRFVLSFARLGKHYHALSNISRLKTEGFFESIIPQHSDQTIENLQTNGLITVYCGFDPSSNSLQLGNLIPLIGLLRLQATGNNTIALIGGSTGLIGDPIGKTKIRSQNVHTDFKTNALIFKHTIQKIQQNFKEQFLPNFHNVSKCGQFNVLNNSEWLENKNLLSFVEEAAANVRLQELINKDSVKLRESSGEGMSIKEFLYPLVQAYDFLHLHENMNCNFQLGGNDQIGNIDTGIALIQRKLKKRAFGITVPLLLSAKGQKIGKTDITTQKDVIWLSSQKLRPFHFYQRLLNQPDTFVTEKVIRQLTFFSNKEIKQLFFEHSLNLSQRIAQLTVARELTLLIHGAFALSVIELASRIFFTNLTSSTHSKKPMQTLANSLSESEKRFLLQSICHREATTNSCLPVLHFTTSYTNPVNQLLWLIQSALKSEQDRGNLLTLDQGVILNDIVVLNPCSSTIQQKIQDTDNSKYINGCMFASESVVKDAWNSQDPSTRINILQIGKRGFWFVFPLDLVT